MEKTYGTKILTNDELGRLHRTVDEIKEQICNQTLEYDSVLKQLKAIIKTKPQVKQDFVVSLWKTVKITQATAKKERVKDILESEGFILTEKAFEAISNEEVRSLNEKDGWSRNIELYLSTPAQLEKIGSSYCEILKEVQGYGLTTCPPQTPQELRLQYANQPKGETLILAKKSYFTTDSFYDGFYLVGHDDRGQYLDYEEGDEVVEKTSKFFGPHAKLVFTTLLKKR